MQSHSENNKSIAGILFLVQGKKNILPVTKTMTIIELNWMGKTNNIYLFYNIEKREREEENNPEWHAESSVEKTGPVKNTFRSSIFFSILFSVFFSHSFIHFFQAANLLTIGLTLLNLIFSFLLLFVSKLNLPGP